MPAVFIALSFFMFQSHMTVIRRTRAYSFSTKKWKVPNISVFSLYLSNWKAVKCACVVTLISQSRDPNTGKIPSEQKWIDDQICIFASQSVFVCGTCNLGKNPYLPWRQAQMNTNFLPKFSEANNLCINVFYIKPFFR